MANNNLLTWLEENEHLFIGPQSEAEKQALLAVRRDVARRRSERVAQVAVEDKTSIETVSDTDEGFSLMDRRVKKSNPGLQRWLGSALAIAAGIIFIVIFWRPWSQRVPDDIRPLRNPGNIIVKNPNKGLSEPGKDPVQRKKGGNAGSLVVKPPDPVPPSEAEMQKAWEAFQKKVESFFAASKSMNPKELEQNRERLRSEHKEMLKNYPGYLVEDLADLIEGRSPIAITLPMPDPNKPSIAPSPIAELLAELDKYPPSVPLDKDDPKVRTLRDQVKLALGERMSAKGKEIDKLASFFRRSKRADDRIPDLRFYASAYLDRAPPDVPILLDTPQGIQTYIEAQRALNQPGIFEPQLSLFVLRARRPGIDVVGTMMTLYSNMNDDVKAREQWDFLCAMGNKGVPIRVAVGCPAIHPVRGGDALYIQKIKDANQSGIQVLVSLACDSTKKKTKDLANEIAAYINAYPDLSGISIVQQPGDATTAQELGQLFTAARQLRPNMVIVWCQGGPLNEEILTTARPDTITLLSTAIPEASSWFAKYDPSRFAAHITQQNDPTQLEKNVSALASRHFSWIYLGVGDGKYLPDYMPAQFNLIQNLNSSIR